MPQACRMDTPDKLLAVEARSQAGAFTRTQARAAGVTHSQIKFRLRNGSWVVVHPGVYCAATTAQGRETTAVAGRLYCGEQARFSHLTAARLLGIDVQIWSNEVWLTIPHQQFGRRQPGLVVTRSRHMPREACVAHDQPVMPPARIIVDLAQVLDRGRLRGVLYDVVRRGVVTVEQVAAEAEGLGGRAGLSLLREVLEEFDPAFESVLEAEADRHFAVAGLKLEPQVEIWDGWDARPRRLRRSGTSVGRRGRRGSLSLQARCPQPRSPSRSGVARPRMGSVALRCRRRTAGSRADGGRGACGHPANRRAAP